MKHAYGSRVALLLLALALPFTVTAPSAAGAASPEELRLIDEVPNLIETLADQWRRRLPADVSSAEGSTEHYGLLLDAAMQPTGLDDCIALALRHNTSLQVQRLNPLAAAAGVRRARSVFDPALFGTVSQDRNTSPATTFLFAGNANILFSQNLAVNAGLRKTLLSGGQLALQFSNNRRLTNPSIANPFVPLYTTSLTATVTQPLLQNFGWRYALLLVDAAQVTEEAVFHQLEAAVANLVARVEATYWTLVLARENVRVQEQGLSVARELLRQNEGKFRVGALPQTAVLEAQVDVANREAFLLQARNGLDVARDTLRALVNAPEEASPTLRMLEAVDHPSVEPYEIDLAASLQRGLEQRPELRAAKSDIEAKGILRKVAQNQLLPQVNLVASAGVNGLAGTDQQILFGNPPAPVPVNPGLRGGWGDALGLLPDGRFYTYAVGANVELPLDRARAKAEYAQANVTLSQSKLSLQQLQESVTLEIKNGVSNLGTDRQSIEATRIARQLAEENLRNQKARYDVGLATTKDLLDYADRLTRAQFAEVNALTRYRTNLAELRRVEGSLLSARNIVLDRSESERAPWWARF